MAPHPPPPSFPGYSPLDKWIPRLLWGRVLVEKLWTRASVKVFWQVLQVLAFHFVNFRNYWKASHLKAGNSLPNTSKTAFRSDFVIFDCPRFSVKDPLGLLLGFPPTQNQPVTAWWTGLLGKQAGKASLKRSAASVSRRRCLWWVSHINHRPYLTGVTGRLRGTGRAETTQLHFAPKTPC